MILDSTSRWDWTNKLFEKDIAEEIKIKISSKYRNINTDKEEFKRKQNKLDTNNESSSFGYLSILSKLDKALLCKYL